MSANHDDLLLVLSPSAPCDLAISSVLMIFVHVLTLRAASQLIMMRIRIHFPGMPAAPALSIRHSLNCS